mgnify:CR=1 FL=1
MKKIVVAIAVVLAVGFTVTSCKSEQKETKEVEKEVIEKVEEVEEKEPETEMMAVAVYQCPMDCEEGKTYDKAGQCPVCKMDLKKQEAEGDVDADAHKEGDGHNHEEGTEEKEG